MRRTLQIDSTSGALNYTGGILVGGVYISDVRYADDITLIKKKREVTYFGKN